MTPLRFVLDGVAGPTEDQEGAYATIAAGATEGVLLGRSCAIIAVGAPSSGKTYSLFGPAEVLANATGSSWKEWGLLPRASHHLFSRASAIGGIEGLLGLGGSFACSFVEICGEQAMIRSLLLCRPPKRRFESAGCFERAGAWPMTRLLVHTHLPNLAGAHPPS